jgi:hypothetical protein
MLEEHFNQLSTLPSPFADLQPHPVRPRLILNLPNLRADQINFLSIPDGIEIRVIIWNTGQRDSGPFRVMTILTRNGELKNPIMSDPLNLPARTAQDVPLIQITDLSKTSAETICATVLVDPPTGDQAWGEVIETNVEDNNLHDCIIISPPEPAMPPPEDGEIGEQN